MLSPTRYAVVTGSADGLGRAMAVRLAGEGWHLALVDLDDEGNRETLAAVRAAGGEGRCERFDVGELQAWRDLHDRLRAEWPRLDLLVNNAGVGGSGEVGKFPIDDWRWLIGTNLMGVVYGCHTMVDWLKENEGRGGIINVSSIASKLSLPCMAAYCSAKAGVEKLSESLRVELSKYGVGVTVVFAGFFQSGLMKRARMTTQFEHDFSKLSMQYSKITADDVARETLRAAARGQFSVIVVSRKIRFFYWLNRLFPRVFMKYVTRQWLTNPPPWV
jgi:NAD(P)-dependent dehydrogenase (short-subunit alcohol dehydrogenase family)